MMQVHLTLIIFVQAILAFIVFNTQKHETHVTATGHSASKCCGHQ